jgi:hypothetical protein
MTPLRSLDLSLRVITPMACGNADFLAEVRPPSFRGAARLWLRILLDGIFGEDCAAVSPCGVEQGAEWLAQALQTLGVGAKTSAGYGFWVLDLP